MDVLLPKRGNNAQQGNDVQMMARAMCVQFIWVYSENTG